MKKVRILSAVMAILMLPLATLFACGETIILTPDPETIIDVNKPATDGETPDNDGTKDGYHLFYSFDAHEAGNLKGGEPYTPFITTAEAAGGNYVIKAKKASTSDKALEIVRAAGNFTAPAVTFDLKTISALGPKHVIEFDLRWEKGLIMDELTFKGVKTESTPFLKADNAGVYDGGGTLLYDGEPGWLKIQIAIDDEACVFDLYINGVKKLHRTPYVTTGYAAWDVEKAGKYTFEVAAGAGLEVTCGIDNFGVRGIESLDNIEYTSADITYKDSYEDNVPFLTATNQGLIDLVSASNKVSKYSGGEDMAGGLTLSAINADGDIIDIHRNWNYLTTGEATLFGPTWTQNATFDLGNGQKIYFMADPDYTVKIGDEYVGTYDTEVFQGIKMATIKWANEKPYKIGEIEMKDAVIATQTVGEGENAKEVPTSITFYKDGERKAGEEIGTFNVTETTDPYVYNPTVPEGYTPVIKVSNFASLGNTVEWMPDNIKNSFDPAIYDTVVFQVYIPQEMVDCKMTFSINFYSSATGTNAEYKQWEFGTARGKKYTAGWNTFEVSVPNGGLGGGSKAFVWSDFTQIRFVFSGWWNGPYDAVVAAGGSGKGFAEDGHAFYVKELAFKSSRSVVVDGPAAGKEDCTHPTFAPVTAPIAATCTTGSYYLTKCTECGATKVDTSREIGLPNGHNYEGASEFVIDPTCDASGYTYIPCVDCGYENVIATTTKVAHEFVTEFDWNALIKTQTCTICGLSSSSNIVKEMPSMPDKIAALEGETIRYFYCDANTNTDYKKDGYTNSSLNGSDVNFAYNCKYACLETVQLPNGDYAFEYTRSTNGGTTSDAYLELNLDDRFGVAASHVVEINLMLGKKGTNGSYPVVTFAQFDRNGTKSNIEIGSTAADGTITLGGYKFNLSDEVMTHVMIVFKPSANAYDVYVNSKLVVEGKAMYANVATASKFRANDFRIAYKANANEAGSSYIFNDFIAYTGNGPINMLPADGDIVETTGTINTGFTGGTVSGTATKVTLPNGALTTKYVAEMDIAGSNLSDGVLLNAVKLVKGFEEKLALLEVKGGKIYSMGVLVADSTNAKIALVCDDQNNVITVYVNGVKVIENYKYTTGAYVNASEYINNFEFVARGSYTVSNFKLYTGTAPQA